MSSRMSSSSPHPHVASSGSGREALQREVATLRSYRDTLHSTMKGLVAKLSGTLPNSAEPELLDRLHKVLVHLQEPADSAVEQTSQIWSDDSAVAEVQRLTKQVLSLQAELTALQQTLDDERALRSTAETRASVAEQKANEVQQQQAKAARSVAVWQKQHELASRETEKLVEALGTRSQQLEEEAAGLEVALVEQAAKWMASQQGLTHTLAGAERETEQRLLSFTTEMQDAVSAAQRQAQVAHDLAKAQAEDAEMERETLREQLSAAKQECSALAAALELTRAERDEARDKLLEVQDELMRLRQELAEARIGAAAVADNTPNTENEATKTGRPRKPSAFAQYVKDLHNGRTPPLNSARGANGSATENTNPGRLPVIKPRGHLSARPRLLMDDCYAE